MPSSWDPCSSDSKGEIAEGTVSIIKVRIPNVRGEENRASGVSLLFPMLGAVLEGAVSLVGSPGKWDFQGRLSRASVISWDSVTMERSCNPGGPWQLRVQLSLAWGEGRHVTCPCFSTRGPRSDGGRGEGGG